MDNKISDYSRENALRAPQKVDLFRAS